MQTLPLPDHSSPSLASAEFKRFKTAALIAEKQRLRNLRLAKCVALSLGIPFAALLPVGSSSSQAATFTYSGATSGVWGDATNWSPNGTPGSADTAIFSGAGNGNTTLDLGAGQNAATVLFDTANAAAYTIGAGAVNSQTLGIFTGVTMNSTVVNNELFNAAITLGTGAAGTFTFTNNSTTNSLTFAGTVTGGAGGTAGAQILTFANNGAINANGAIKNGGASALAVNKTGTGTLTLGAANTYTGATTFGANSSGTIVLANPGGFANTSSFNFQAFTGNTLDLATDGTENAFPLGSGTGFNGTIVSDRNTAGPGINHTVGLFQAGGGTLNITAGSMVTSGTASLTFSSISITAGTAQTLTLNPVNTTAIVTTASILINNAAKVLGLSGNTTTNVVTGAITNGVGTLGVSKLGTSTWTLNGTNTYTGPTTVNGGTLQLNGTGVNNGASAYTLLSGTFLVDNTTAAGGNSNARIADASTIALSGGNFLYRGSDAATTNSTETVGAISGTGTSVFTITPGGTNTATVTAASFTHAAGNGTDLVNGTGLGSTGTAPSRFIITTAPTLTGTTAATTTGINAAVKNTSIVPFLVGEATTTTGGLGTATGAANTFLTYNATTGLRPLNPTDEFTNNAITAGNNTYITAATTAGATAAINSLVVNGGNLTITDGATLTDTSGALLFASSNTIAPSATTGALAFGAEAQIHVAPGVTGTISAPITGGTALTKSGPGTLTLAGVNTYTGATTVNTGRVNVTGSITASTTIAVGALSAAGAALYQSGSSSVVTNTSAAGGGFQIGSAPGAVGYYNLAAGTVNVGGEIDPGGSAGGAGTFGQLDVSGGTINLPSASTPYFLIDRGAAGEAAVFNLSGGTVQILGGATVTNSAFNGLAVGIANASGYTSAITISGSGQFLTPSLTTKLNDTNFGATAGNAANASVLNMNGGTLQTLGFGTVVNASALGSNNAVINLNGGTIKAGSAGNTGFLAGLGAVNVYSGGGTIDNNGQAITIGQSLLAASGTGVNTVAVGTAGTGYIVPPRVVFSGGTLTGGLLANAANGYATIDPTTGAVTGIVITNPGSYTSTSGLTVALLGPTGGTTAALGTLALNAGNSSGGMAYLGAGTTTLSGASTYTGATSISVGTIKNGVINAIPAASALTVSGGTYDLAGFADGVASLSDGGVSTGTVTNSGAVAALSTNGTASTTFSGLISGTVNLLQLGASTLTLSNASNSYTGGTTIGAGQNNSVLRATASGALGTGTLSLDSGGNASTARLELAGGITLANAIAFTGRNNASVGIENISGNNTLSGLVSLNSGGGTYIVQSDAGTLAFTNAGTSTIGGNKTLTFTGAGNGSFAGVLTSVVQTSPNLSGGVAKSGAGLWTLTGANTYLGATSITGGTLSAASTTGNALGSTSGISVSGGGTLLLSQPNQVLASAVASTATPAAAVTLGVAATSVGNVAVAAGASQGSAATSGGNPVTITGTTAQGLGALTLNNTATLTFSGASTTLVFNTFTPNGNVLTIGGYTNVNANSSTLTSGSGTDDRLVFFGDQSGNYNNFDFGAGAGVGVSEVALDGGFYEVYGTVPEPTTILGGVLLLGVAGYRGRRRLSSLWQA